MTIPRNRVAWLLAIVIVLMVVTAGFGLKRYLSQRALALEMRQRLDRELADMPVPAQATKIRRVGSFKGTHGSVANYYATSLRYDEIRAYYDRELATRGWKLNGESKLQTWGKDLGESERIYCRDPLAVSIYFTGENEAAFGYRYAVDVNWRLVEECDD
jgi:hypothetical protein